MNAFFRTALALSGIAVLGTSPVFAQASRGLPTVPAGFTIERIATVPAARELAVTPNGDLLVATGSANVYIVPGAQSTPGKPTVFTHVDDRPVAGLTIDGERMYLGGNQGVYELPYRTGDQIARAQPRKIAAVRPAGAKGHATTSVAVANKRLYASVGSSCNACDPEADPTRATIEQLDLDGSGMTPKARHIRNAIALAANPATGTLWAGVAGQDELAHGHPYEIFDAVTLHDGVADYGWPHCYENHKPVEADADCSKQTVARVVFPAYQTPIGAAFYPEHPGGVHAFPEAYRGGAFVTLHGSWHTPPVPPRVVFVAMNGDDPKTAVNWDDPAAQWKPFLGGFQSGDGDRIARPTGIAVGTDGSLFVSEDQTGAIYRIRPS